MVHTFGVFFTKILFQPHDGDYLEISNERIEENSYNQAFIIYQE